MGGGVWTQRLIVASAGTLPLGCQVRGVVGSNVDGETRADGGADATTSSASDADSSAPTGAPTSETGSDGTASETLDDGGPRFDLMQPDAPAVCLPPTYAPCDALDDDPWHAMGIGCDGSPPVQTEATGSPLGVDVFAGTLGTLGTFSPREGQKFTILSTGHAHQLRLTPTELMGEVPGCSPATCPSTQLDPDKRLTLPAPIDVRPVADGRDCFDDPTLVGHGDCSNTLYDQWLAGSGAYDYVDLRMRMVVPDNVDAIRYDFAFFTSEYPLFAGHDSSWNDMYIAWLESEAWTGNISFDELGNPISINSVLLDYMDGDSALCPGCTAPELHGFAMEGHAGTNWLESTAPVQPGEVIELVFAIFDLSDGLFDSLVLLDNVEWTCTHTPPSTVPAG